MLKSPAEINKFGESIIYSPVRVDSDHFVQLSDLLENKGLSDANKLLLGRALVYCYICDSFQEDGSLNSNFMEIARGKIDNCKHFDEKHADKNKLRNEIYEDICNSFKLFQRLCHTIEEDENAKEKDEKQAIQLKTYLKQAQIAYGMYFMYHNDSDSKEVSIKAFESAFIFLHYASMNVLDNQYDKIVHGILTDGIFCDPFFVNKIRGIMSDQRALSTCNIHFMDYIFDKYNSNDLYGKTSTSYKSLVGYLIILYMAERYRLIQKKRQELLNEKQKTTFLLKTIKKLNKLISVELSKRIRIDKENNSKLEDLDKIVQKIEKRTNALLSDNDIRQLIYSDYKMSSTSSHVESLVSRSELFFYKTGSTSIILKFSHDNKPTVLKLVKPCFFNNSRIQHATSELKQYYEDIDDKIVHESSDSYAIMQFIEGKTITEYTTQSNSDDNRHKYLNNIQKIIEGIFDQLEILHNRDKFHKDLSKDNIIVSSTNHTPRFIDYGQNYVIADVSSADQYSDISISIAPEVLSCSVKNEHDFLWADLYSAGIIILELYSNKVAKDKNVLATLLDDAWEKSPPLAYLVELLIDERVENRKKICTILNSGSLLLKNLLPETIFTIDSISTKQVVPFVAHVPGTKKDDCEQNVTSHSEDAVGIHYFLKNCFVEILKSERSSLKEGKSIDRDIIQTAVFEFNSLRKSVTTNSVNFVKNIFGIIKSIFFVLYFCVTKKNYSGHVFIKDYLKFFSQLNTLSWMAVWFFSIGFFARFFHDTTSDKALLSSLDTKLDYASANFFTFLHWIPGIRSSQVTPFQSGQTDATIITTVTSFFASKIDGIYSNFFSAIYKLYSPDNWDIVLSALIVGTTFVMCATPYYKIIFSNISLVDFYHISPSGSDISRARFLKRLSLRAGTFISEFFVRSTSFIHAIPIIIGMCHPFFWATCSWIGVIPVTLNSFINTKYLKNTYKIYTDKSYFVLPISNAVKETVDKFSYWHVLLIAYIVVLLVGDFGLRGNIFQDWLMYSFLVAVVNVVKMQIFNCYKEGPGVHSTIYRCYAACLRSKYLTKSQH